LKEESGWHLVLVGTLVVGCVLIGLRWGGYLSVAWTVVTLPLWIIPAMFLLGCVAVLIGSLLTGWWTPFARESISSRFFKHK